VFKIFVSLDISSIDSILSCEIVFQQELFNTLIGMKKIHAGLCFCTLSITHPSKASRILISILTKYTIRTIESHVLSIQL
jgi:hypothetical protein